MTGKQIQGVHKVRVHFALKVHTNFMDTLYVQQQLILPLLKKYFAVINHILYLKKGFKVIPLFAVTSDFESPNQHALNLHLQGLNVQSHHSLEGLTNFKDFHQFTGFQNHFYYTD